MRVRFIQIPDDKVWKNFLSKVLVLEGEYEVVRPFGENGFVILGSDGQEYALSVDRFEIMDGF
jgi:hypothetical protein